MISIVTGCSSGFGTAIALSLVAEGHTVVATVRRAASAPELLRGREREGLHVRELDVIDANSRRRLIDGVETDLGPVDALINNAGVLLTAAIEDSSDHLTRKVFDTNFHGPLELTRAVLPGMRDRKRGRIVNVTAVGAILSTPLYGVYAASKHALDAATAALDIEVRDHGVRAVSILPGPFATSVQGRPGMSVVAEPYQALQASLEAARAQNGRPPATDLSPVARAVVAALTDPHPQPRYLVGEGAIVEAIKPSVEDLARLHAFESDRARTHVVAGTK